VFFDFEIRMISISASGEFRYRDTSWYEMTMTHGFKTLLSIVLLAIMAATGPACAEPVKILALGTSLTQGYGLPPGTEFTVQLQKALKQAGIDAVITNAGVSGDTSAGGLARLDWSLADHPGAVILELGSNDMLRGIAPAETEKNLRAILTRLKAARVKVLLTGMQASAIWAPIMSGSSTASIRGWPRITICYSIPSSWTAWRSIPSSIRRTACIPILRG